MCLPVVVLAGAVKQHKPVRLIDKTIMKYSLMQDVRVVGGESIIRSTYSDNRVEFEAESEMGTGQSMHVSTTSKLIVDEESMFPQSLEILKKMNSDDVEIAHTIRAEMFANVAVVTTILNGREDVREIVVPTGAAFIDIGVVHQLYAVLSAYNQKAGGRQNVPLVDLITFDAEEAALTLVGTEKLEVMGEVRDVRKYDLERSKIKMSFQVDESGRIVRVDQPGMFFELTEWIEEKSPK